MDAERRKFKEPVISLLKKGNEAHIKDLCHAYMAV